MDVVAERRARNGLSRSALKIAPTGERTMRSAITRPTKYQNARNTYIDQSVSKLSLAKPRLKLGVGTPGRPFSPPVKSDNGLNDKEKHFRDRHRDHRE